MYAAAVALTRGWDPMAYLALNQRDESIADAILAKAVEITNEHDKALADYTADRIVSRVAPVIVRNSTRLIHFLRKSLSN